MHAAGFHTDPAHGHRRRTVLDRVVSSSTPTIRALRYARDRQSQPGSPAPIVAMPTTPGGSPLQHVSGEVHRIQGFFHCPVPLTETAPTPDGTPSLRVSTRDHGHVLARLPHCDIAHFACHGARDRTAPSQSRLLLHDHATTPLTVATLARADFDHTQLAYLSTCDAADPGSINLLDEFIHRTSAFRLARFPHLIGTFWSISDRPVTEMAESFYTQLATGPARNAHPRPSRDRPASHHPDLRTTSAGSFPVGGLPPRRCRYLIAVPR